MQHSDLKIVEKVPLARFTTLELGGPASYLTKLASTEDLVQAIRWAGERGIAFALLAGGSNVVISDQGFAGLVGRVALRGVETLRRSEGVYLTAAAGEPWDEVVATAVEQGLSGIECLSGIPGTVGATPIQNVGAYGQEVADTISRVDVLDRRTGRHRSLTPRECGFSYRDSRFKTDPHRFVVLAVTYLLQPDRMPAIRYPQLAAALSAHEPTPTPARVREAVLALRGEKSMVLAEGDPNRRSVGSFFVNPVASASQVERIQGLFPGDGLPRYANPDGGVKIPAAWLIEHAGFSKGFTRGAVGVSSRHSLALVHHGDGSTEELIALARDIRRAVRNRFDVDLKPEPTFLGFAVADPTA